MIQQSRIILRASYQRFNFNTLKQPISFWKNYLNLTCHTNRLTFKQQFLFSQFENKEQFNVRDAQNLDKEQLRMKEEEQYEKQKQFILEQIEQKKKFDELFNIFVEKKEDEMRIVRLYKYYRKKYKHQTMNLKTFILLNIVLIISILILPSKEFNLQKAFQMRFINTAADIMYYLQKNTSESQMMFNLVSPKQYMEFVFLTFKYMERNDIFDLDYIVQVLHNITLIIYQQSETEKKQSLQNIKIAPKDKESNLMILGSIMNISQIVKEQIQIKPHIFLERDFQEVLTDYLEIISLNSEGLANLRRNFLDSKENLLNSESYDYYIGNQLNFNYLADKSMVYDCLLRLVEQNIDWNQYLLNFLENFRIQFYKDIANQSESSTQITQKSIRLAVILFSNKECQKKLIEDKLLSNLIKLFTIKKNNMYEEELKTIIQYISSNKEILLQKENQRFREEFKEFTNIRSQSNQKAKQMLEPLFK